MGLIFKSLLFVFEINSLLIKIDTKPISALQTPALVLIWNISERSGLLSST